MSETLKVSGKKVPFAQPSQPHQWKFEVRPGGWIIAISESGIRKRFMLYEKKGRTSANLGGFLWAGEWIVDSRGASHAGSDADLVAQFPGKVRKILVAEGDRVQEGDSLLLMEAMKMEFTIRAPFPGVVKNLLVQEGQQISLGDRFVNLEASGNVL